MKLCALVEVHHIKAVPRVAGRPTWILEDATLVSARLHQDDLPEHGRIPQGQIRVCADITMVQEELPMEPAQAQG